jgi:adenylate kinase
VTLLLLMGIAGSGKGTQGAMIAERKGYRVISMGDVLRTYATDKQRERMLAGELLDDNEIISIIDDVFNAAKSNESLIMDGFPRSIPQAEWLMSQVESGRFKLSTALHLVASREAVKARLLSRGRVDDTDEAIEARFNEYERSTHPLIDWLSEHGVRVVNVNAEQTVEQVNEDLLKVLD